MAVSFTVRGTPLHDDVDRTAYSYLSASLTAGRNYILFVNLTHGTAAPTCTPTATSETITEYGTAGGILYASNARRLQAYTFVAAATASKTITLTCSAAATATSCDAVLVELQGENTASPIVNSTSSSQTANTTRTVTLPTFASSSNRGLIFLCNGSAAAGQTGVDSPWSMLNTGGHANPNNGSMTAGNATDNDNTALFTWTANVQAAWFGFEIAVASAGVTFGRVYQNGAWRTVTAERVYQNGAWRAVTAERSYQNGAWRSTV